MSPAPACTGSTPTRRSGRRTGPGVLDLAATRSVASLRRVLAPTGIFVQVGAAKHGGWFGVFGRIINVMLRRRLLRQRVTFFVAKPGIEDLVTITELIQAGTVRPALDPADAPP